MAPKKGTKEPTLISADVKASASVKAQASDLLGLGAAAKSPAGKEIARAIGGPLGEAINTATTALLGRRAAKIRSEARVLEAQSDAEARIITAHADEEVRTLRAAAQRLRSKEIRRQAAIETARDDAISIADQRNSGEIKEVDEEFAEQWVDGVKDVRSETVRKLYSRLLESQTRPGSNRVSGPSMQLMRNLDGHLAEQFAKFVSIMIVYSAYPAMQIARASGNLALDARDLALLEEIGFIIRRAKASFRLREFDLQINQKQIIPVHDQFFLTQRGRELAGAFYGEYPMQEGLAKYAPTEVEMIDFYRNIIETTACSYEDGALISFERSGIPSIYSLKITFPDVQAGSSTQRPRRRHYPKVGLNEVREEIDRIKVSCSDIAWKAISLAYAGSECFVSQWDGPIIE